MTPLEEQLPSLLERFFGQLPDPEDGRAQTRDLVDLCDPIHNIVTLRCEYNTAGRAEVAALPSGKFSASGFRRRDFSIIFLGLGDPRAWHRTVYAEGLEVIDGCFVLAVLEREDASATVICVRQGRGSSVHPELWHAEKSASGWKLSARLKDPDLLDALCSRPNSDHEPDDPLWHKYASVMSSKSFGTLSALSSFLMTPRPKPEPAGPHDDAIEARGDYDN
jgi:hypothetical protein